MCYDDNRMRKSSGFTKSILFISLITSSASENSNMDFPPGIIVPEQLYSPKIFQFIRTDSAAGLALLGAVWYLKISHPCSEF